MQFLIVSYVLIKPIHFLIDSYFYLAEDENNKSDRQNDRQQKRFLNSEMVRDVLEEHNEDPEVVLNGNNEIKRKAEEKRREIER